jgi:hypothetical protein
MKVIFSLTLIWVATKNVAVLLRGMYDFQKTNRKKERLLIIQWLKLKALASQLERAREP